MSCGTIKDSGQSAECRNYSTFRIAMPYLTTLFIGCVSAVERDPIILPSPRGKKVCELLCHIEEICEKVYCLWGHVKASFSSSMLCME